MSESFEAAFNLLCGKKIGGGIHRDVFECRLDESLVVKVETDGEWRYFANPREMQFWCDNQYAESVAKWLAPCVHMSPCGRVMTQKRAEPIQPSYTLPDKLPAFLTDIKRENFGLIDGKLVCVDYAMVIQRVPTNLRKAGW